MSRLAVLVAACVLAASSTALAAPPGMVPVESPTPATRTQHYGYQIFLADLGWFAAAGLLAKSDASGGGGDLVVLGYYGAGPAIHLAHGNQSGAAKSLAARALLPLAGGVIGLTLGSQGTTADSDSALGGMVIGALAGGVTAMVLDWTVIGKKEVAAPKLPLALRPGVSIGKHALAFSLGGAF